jgi:hypothetical protein
MALDTQARLALYPPFRDKVTIAMVQQAIAVQGEATATANHANRSAYAREVLNAPEQFTPRFVLAVMADETIALNATDQTLKDRVAAVFNALAGTL